jgi:beclin
VILEQAEEKRSLKVRLRNAQEQLQRLQRVNVLDMVFFIWMDGEYGTISGLRLGRLKTDFVDWHEINAALGQCAFLLKVINL